MDGNREDNRFRHMQRQCFVVSEAGRAADRRYRLLRFVLAAVVLCMAFLTGCDESFQPFEENDIYYFSIFGYLDASADTQWVRVTPAREQLELPSTLPDVRVTLEDLQSGELAVMNDTTVELSGGSRALNFWSTMAIEHARSYRLIAERPDGATSRVTVTLPEELPTPRVRKETTPGQPTTYSVYVDDTVEHLVDVQTVWYVRIQSPGFEEQKVFSFSHREKAELIQAYGGVYSVFIRPAEELEQIEEESAALLTGDSEIEVLHRQVYVASGGPDWNEEIPSMEDLVYALPGQFSNVENGLGYLVGIDSKIVPLKSCFDDQAVLVPCPEEEPYW